MRFELSDSQQAIRQTAREFLAARFSPTEVRRLAFDDERGFTDAQWDELAELGWPALILSEGDGGLGLGAVELAVVQEELGYALAPTPLLSTIAAALLIAAAGSGEQRSSWLPRIAAGETLATLATLDGDTPVQARGGILSGEKIAVPDADAVDLLVVATEAGVHHLVDPRDPGVGRTPTASLDPTRKRCAISFDEVPGEPLALPAAAEVARAYDTIALASAAESVGVAQRALELAVAYAKERLQFGRPIGSYQAVSHACARMLLETESARSAVLYAAWTLDQHRPDASRAVSVAKVCAGEAGWRVPAAALQVHAGVGYTWEHDLQLWLKRGRANAQSWGGRRHHLARVADLLEL
jgi:alkylation response protein AidB-like acyl-CoA dehydrogenase